MRFRPPSALQPFTSPHLMIVANAVEGFFAKLSSVASSGSLPLRLSTYKPYNRFLALSTQKATPTPQWTADTTKSSTASSVGIKC